MCISIVIAFVLIQQRQFSIWVTGCLHQSKGTVIGRLVNRIYFGGHVRDLYLFECAGEKVYERQPEDYSQHPTLSQ